MRAVANRYARALADVVGRSGDFRVILSELRAFADVYGESSELRGLFDLPGVPIAQKNKVLEAVLERLEGSEITRNFLRVVLANFRMSMLETIVQAFRRIAHLRLGVVEVMVLSAAELTEGERQALETRFRELTGNQVEIEIQLARDLLGGIVAQVGSTVYDGSVRGYLEQIRRRLAAQ